ncbi:MAG: IS21 family transposase [Pseudomonadota bacterium]
MKIEELKYYGKSIAELVDSMPTIIMIKVGCIIIKSIMYILIEKYTTLSLKSIPLIMLNQLLCKKLSNKKIMISMVTKQEVIRRYFREHDSERKIARDLQISRVTVKKYLQEYISVLEKPGIEASHEGFQEYSGLPPKYDGSNRSKRKLNQEIENIIKDQLQENDRKRREGMRKQVKLKIDIHEHILMQGYQIGYTTVCNYIRFQEYATREAFIRQSYVPGEECEFDWAEVKLKIAGHLRRLYMAVFTSSFGNYRFSRLYNRQNTLAFMESHNEFFAHVGGVYHEMVYDNMRVAIAEFVGRNEKVPTRALTNLSGWFQFRWRFCNVRRGNEKGHVERSVEYVRRKAFSHKDDFDSIEHAQEYLLATLEKINSVVSCQKGISPLVALAQEKSSLWKFPGIMDCYLTECLKVDKYSTFSYGTNRYSVPDYLVGRMVEVKAYSKHLQVYHNNLQVCRHDRDYGMYQWQINLEHYLVTLSRKPGALHGSVAMEQSLPAIRALYKDFFVNQPRGFVDILMYCQAHQIPHQKLIDAVTGLSLLCPKDVSADKVIALLGNQPLVHLPFPAANDKGEIEGFSMQQLKEISLLTNGNIN